MREFAKANLPAGSLPLPAEEAARPRSEIRKALFVPDPLPRLDPETHGAFEPAPGVRVERVTYGTQFGMRVPALVYSPSNHAGGRLPGLILVNGHGGSKYTWFVYCAAMLYAKAGAVVLMTDLMQAVS